MKRRILAALAALGFAAALTAHGGGEHVVGFVKAIGPQSMTVETLKNRTVMVVLTTKTDAVKGGVRADLKDLKVGDRVVIHATRNGAGVLEANEVEWGPAATSGAPKK
jgi:hypothetical protein